MGPIIALGAAMPRLVRLYLFSIGCGACLALVFITLLVTLDVAGLRHLVGATRGGFIAVAMLFIFHMLLFSGVQFGIAVMRMADSPPRRPGGKKQTVRLAPALVISNTR